MALPMLFEYVDLYSVQAARLFSRTLEDDWQVCERLKQNGLERESLGRLVRSLKLSFQADSEDRP
jgi:hypothetical protein